ncbi:ATP-dependent RNA helicase DHX33-like isoform X2 [Vespa velutina]|uniref:ATP-dependent RNA helicase DHX33-like isoform X2 n=1 Tax=Vespa velutina TaxID=202808 RepID=UPI001FB41829|nr:ATP-dependent RNA helicase DHX33-like isoform X2 [Vespa velutina]
MGVHDNADSKYNVMGTSSFSKLAPKRPNTVVFGESPAKVQKHEESSGSSFSNVENTTEPGSTSVHQQRKSLPVYRLRKRLLEEIRRYSTLIIIGETGSGKTTQIPQLLLSSGIAGVSGRVGVTQPRRVAAVSIARRVAQEQGVETGKLVGYCVRFEDVTSPQTRIKYLTDGMMVREAMTDEILSDYSVVILDEAHERSVQTDVLLGVTKRAQNLRKLKNLPPLKLLVMSATIDADKFAKYFHAPVLYLEGRQHPVKIYHAVKSQEDYVFSSMVTAFQIHRETPANEDILVFLTGQEEIETAVVNAKQVAKQLDGKGYPPLKVFPLYSALPTHQQLEAFKPAPTGMRKLIFSTNVAETSVTIGGSPPQLTTLGRTMSLFPLDPRFTKVILASVEHRCLEEALTVVALLSGESIFTDPPAKRQQAYAAKSRFASPEGDHVTLLNVFRGYTSTGSQKKVWCHENFLHHRNLEYATEVRKQLATLAERANLDKASCGTNTEQLRKALLEGLYENLAELQRDNNTYVTVSSKQPVAIHPSSTLHGTKPSLILFTEIVATGKCYLRDLSVIENSWLSEKGVVAIKHE